MERTASDPPAKAPAEADLPACSLHLRRETCQPAPRQSSDRDVVSSHGGKGRNFRDVVDTTPPRSGSTGLQGSSALKLLAHAWQEQCYQGITLPHHRDLPAATQLRGTCTGISVPGSATSGQLCSHPAAAPPAAERSAAFWAATV